MQKIKNLISEFKEPKKTKKSSKKSVSSDFMKESFEKMNLEKIQELKERILSKEEEIFKKKNLAKHSSSNLVKKMPSCLLLE